jgi:predicted RNA-binding protein associated with RNAse of E/G family
MERRFAAGTPVALREVWRGSVWTARAAVVVEDGPGQVVLYIPTGTRWFAPVRDGRRLKLQGPDFELAELPNDDVHVLSFAWPEVHAAVLLRFRPDWSPIHWYVNLEDPLRRSEVGFDTLDHKLDVILELDGSWRWKDEDEFVEAIRLGLIDADEEPALRTAAEDAVRRITGGEPPFDREWTSWRPDPSWPLPELPEGWERV